MNTLAYLTTYHPALPLIGPRFKEGRDCSRGIVTVLPLTTWTPYSPRSYMREVSVLNRPGILMNQRVLGTQELAYTLRPGVHLQHPNYRYARRPPFPGAPSPRLPPDAL
jgi:hypothetical protein